MAEPRLNNDQIPDITVTGGLVKTEPGKNVIDLDASSVSGVANTIGYAENESVGNHFHDFSGNPIYDEFFQLKGNHQFDPDGVLGITGPSYNVFPQDSVFSFCTIDAPYAHPTPDPGGYWSMSNGDGNWGGFVDGNGNTYPAYGRTIRVPISPLNGSNPVGPHRFIAFQDTPGLIEHAWWAGTPTTIPLSVGWGANVPDMVIAGAGGGAMPYIITQPMVSTSPGFSYQANSAGTANLVNTALTGLGPAQFTINPTGVLTGTFTTFHAIALRAGTFGSDGAIGITSYVGDGALAVSKFVSFSFKPLFVFVIPSGFVGASQGGAQVIGSPPVIFGGTHTSQYIIPTDSPTGCTIYGPGNQFNISGVTYTVVGIRPEGLKF